MDVEAVEVEAESKFVQSHGARLSVFEVGVRVDESGGQAGLDLDGYAIWDALLILLYCTLWPYFYEKRNSTSEKEVKTKGKEGLLRRLHVRCKIGLNVVLKTAHGSPTRNCYRMTSELSRGNELPNAFLDRIRWLKLLQENILQGG